MGPTDATSGHDSQSHRFRSLGRALLSSTSLHLKTDCYESWLDFFSQLCLNVEAMDLPLRQLVDDVQGVHPRPLTPAEDSQLFAYVKRCVVSLPGLNDVMMRGNPNLSGLRALRSLRSYFIPSQSMEKVWAHDKLVNISFRDAGTSGQLWQQSLDSFSRWLDELINLDFSVHDYGFLLLTRACKDVPDLQKEIRKRQLVWAALPSDQQDLTTQVLPYLQTAIRSLRSNDFSASYPMGDRVHAVQSSTNKPSADSTKSDRPKPPRCGYCHRRYHTEAECRTKARDQAAAQPSTTVSSAAVPHVSDVSWSLDTGEICSVPAASDGE